MLLSSLKNTLSILLFGLLIFNTMGFSVYNILERNEANSEMMPGKNAGMILKFPVSLPYVSDWQSSEEIQEEILHGKDFYDVVSKEIRNDTLYVKCQYNENAHERFWSLVSTFDDDVKSGQDAQKSTHDFLLKSLLKEYMANGHKHIFLVLEWFTPLSSQPFLLSLKAISLKGMPAPPPDSALY